MRLATLKDGTPDGQLVVISKTADRYLPAARPFKTLQTVMENWDEASPYLKSLEDGLTDNPAVGSQLNPEKIIAPLPRAWQWLDGSVYTSHAHLMERLKGDEPKEMKKPYMYQGVSNKFYGPTDDFFALTEEDNIDFEGEYGIIVDEVPAGTSAADAAKYIRLIVQINDWSLRKYAFEEMSTGFGWIAAKPPCSMAPFAITPDELGKYWKDNRCHLKLRVDWNGKQFGDARGGDMAVGFNELVAHAARTRTLVAGTVIGSGTVSNEDYREVGSSCIAERRGIEMTDEGEPKTNWMKFGDTIRMEAGASDGLSPFGEINQKVVKMDRT